jgi:hypothetical protein
MAWTDQCRLEAVQQIDHNIDQGMPVREALKAVSAESDIPAGTLKRWKYPEKSVPKNGNGKPPTQRVVWNNVEQKLTRLVEYMEENCEPIDGLDFISGRMQDSLYKAIPQIFALLEKREKAGQ